MDHNDREERFKHLLQPIRDLAQNWDVDIASSLEDYLEDLEEITITLDGGASKVNFAEAALLIQGSTCVYSRKVEHVYQLVLRTIEFLTEQKQANATRNAQNGDGSSDDPPVEEETMFLPLDNCLEEGKNIDLPVAQLYMAASGGRSSAGRRSSVSMGGIGLASRATDDGWEGPARRSRVGAPARAISRPPMFLMEQDYGNSFKMSTCAVDQSGALLIEGAPLGSSTTLKGGTRFSIGSNADTSTCSTDFWGGLRREGVIDTSGMASSGRWAIGDLGGMGIGDGDSDEDDAGGGGFGDFGGYDVDDGGNGTGVEEAEDMMQEHMNPPSAPSHCTPTEVSVPTARWQLRQRAEQLQQDAREEVKAAKRADPWAPLDPHDPGNAKARPIRKGRTYRLPAHLKRRRVHTEVNQPCEGSVNDEDRRGTWIGHDGRLIPSVPLHGLAYPEFEYIDRREKQRKALQVRLARRQAREFMGREQFLAEALSGPNPASEASLNVGEQGHQGAFDNGYVSGGGYSGYSSDGGGGEGGGVADAGGREGYANFGGESDGDDYDDLDGDEGMGGSGEDGAGVAPISLEDAFREKPQTYEDLCRSHIEAFMRGTERYAHETQLSRRVGAWQNKLEPLMRRQDKREAFDIHKYGKSVLASVASLLTPSQRARAQRAKKGEREKTRAKKGSGAGHEAEEPEIPLVDFTHVVGGKEQFDVCRLFLASLQLANNGNVRLTHGEHAADQESTPFRLELLTLQDANNMHGHFAPPAALSTGPENAL